MNLYYFNPYHGNFGDELGVEIVNRLLGFKAEAIDLNRQKRVGHGVMALGSIFHYAAEKDIIWGTGINPRWQKKKPFRHLDIRAVRGPLTRAFIQQHLKHDCPDIFGDPALLTSKLFPEWKVNPVRPYGVIPHFWDIGEVRAIPNVIFPNAKWQDVLSFIMGCELVISSSLHGIIVAESFGIPARWWHSKALQSSRTEGTFKYNDYYASTNRSQDDWASSIEQAILMGGKEPVLWFNDAALIDSFPRFKLSQH